jgi:transposase-like protein
VLDILQGKRAVAEVSRQYDLTPSEIEEWVEEARRGMENALRARPRDMRAEYEGRIKELQAKVGELVLENDAPLSRRRWTGTARTRPGSGARPSSARSSRPSR